MQSFESIRSHVQGKYKITAREPYLICVELSLKQGRRHQGIFLSELEGDDARKYLRVSTTVAPMTGIDTKRMLAFNWQSRVGYMARGELDAVPYRQLRENRPYESLTRAEIDRLLLVIGGIVDDLERMLSAGGDLL